ncbi:MAG: four helix bundle protein [Saprospiraceae bacterium]|nr:four helix bundle protein [Saprospiraceae bacterium]
MSYTYAFEKLTVWQMNRQFAKKLYLKTKSFPKEELFGITSQIRRACISVSCNLAEGSARKTPKEQLRFYEIAFGSAAGNALSNDDDDRTQTVEPFKQQPLGGYKGL